MEGPFSFSDISLNPEERCLGLSQDKRFTFVNYKVQTLPSRIFFV